MHNNVHNKPDRYNLVAAYIKAASNVPVTIHAANGAATDAIQLLSGNHASMVITESFKDKTFTSTVSHITSITPKKAFTYVFRLPQNDTTHEMKQWHAWQTAGTRVRVFLTNGYQMHGTITSYSNGAIVLRTEVGNIIADTLLLSISKVSADE